MLSYKELIQDENRKPGKVLGNLRYVTLLQALPTPHKILALELDLESSHSVSNGKSSRGSLQCPKLKLLCES